MLQLTSVKVRSRRATVRSCVITLNLLFRIGTAAKFAWTSTMSPTLNCVGSASTKLAKGVVMQ